MRTLVIADNQDITKAGILYLIDKMPKVGLVTEAADKKELLRLLGVEVDADQYQSSDQVEL